MTIHNKMFEYLLSWWSLESLCISKGFIMTRIIQWYWHACTQLSMYYVSSSVSQQIDTVFFILRFDNIILCFRFDLLSQNVTFFCGRFRERKLLQRWRILAPSGRRHQVSEKTVVWGWIHHLNKFNKSYWKFILMPTFSVSPYSQ